MTKPRLTLRRKLEKQPQAPAPADPVATVRRDEFRSRVTRELATEDPYYLNGQAPMLRIADMNGVSLAVMDDPEERLRDGVEGVGIMCFSYGRMDYPIPPELRTLFISERHGGSFYPVDGSPGLLRDARSRQYAIQGTHAILNYESVEYPVTAYAALKEYAEDLYDAFCESGRIQIFDRGHLERRAAQMNADRLGPQLLDIGYKMSRRLAAQLAILTTVFTVGVGIAQYIKASKAPPPVAQQPAAKQPSGNN